LSVHQKENRILIPQPSLNRGLSRSSSIFYLFIVPVLLFVIGLLLIRVRGPFFVKENFDPEYVYLLNSLLMLNFHRPSHMDHPGTPLQVFGAILILLRFFARPGQHLSLTQSVLRNPESYLYFINYLLLLISCASLAYAGWRMRRQMGLGFALAFQCGCLLFSTILISTTRVTPELAMIPVAFFLMIFLQEAADEPITSGKNAIWIGALLGLGVACKFTFLPLCLTLFLLRPWSRRIKGFASFVISFVLFTLPVSNRYMKMVSWLKALLTHQGFYGTGPEGIPSFRQFVENAQLLISQEPYFFVVVATVTVLFLAIYRKGQNARTFAIALLVIFVQLLIVLKHAGIYYLLPSMLLAGWLQALAWEQSKDRKLRTLVAIAFLFAAGVFLVFRLSAWTTRLSNRNIDAQELARFTRAQNCQVIPYYTSSFPPFALAFGNSAAARLFSGQLHAFYPDQYYYESDGNNFSAWDGSLRNEKVEKSLAAGKCIFLQGIPLQNQSGITVERLLGKDEVVYRLIRFRDVAPQSQ
jgi:hypothetical protein